MYEIYTIVIVIGTVVLMDLKCFFFGGCSSGIHHDLRIASKESFLMGRGYPVFPQILLNECPTKTCE